MKKPSFFGAWVFGLVGLAAGLLVAAGVWLGKQSPGQSHQEVAREMILNAGAGTSNDAFAVCTGMLGDDGEGLIMLDFLTGELTVIGINPRFGKVGLMGSTNVVAALGAEADKKPRYLLTSGMMDFPRGGGALRPARSLIYVVDANTGAFATYSIPWNPNAWNQGGTIKVPLTPVYAGRARNVQIGE